MRKKDLSQLAEKTQQVYERNARRFANDRPKSLVEKPWLERFRNLIPQRGKILDLGCGAGEPIAAYLIQEGHRVIGLDASNNMIQLAQENIPNGDWRVGDIRTFEFHEKFHGIIGWNSFFHLTREEQRHALPNIVKHLLPKGALLLTVGPHAGEVAGCVGDDPIYHASLSFEEYSRILSRHGMQVKSYAPEDPTCYDMTPLLAQKVGK